MFQIFHYPGINKPEKKRMVNESILKTNPMNNKESDEHNLRQRLVTESEVSYTKSISEISYR